jgi:hypothetical protein
MSDEESSDQPSAGDSAGEQRQIRVILEQLKAVKQAEVHRKKKRKKTDSSPQKDDDDEVEFVAEAGGSKALPPKAAAVELEAKKIKDLAEKVKADNPSFLDVAKLLFDMQGLVDYMIKYVDPSGKKVGVQAANVLSDKCGKLKTGLEAFGSILEKTGLGIPGLGTETGLMQQEGRTALDPQRVTYASKVKSKQTQERVVVVKPKSKSQTNTQLREELLRKIKPQKQKLKIDTVREIRNNEGLLISTRDKDTMTKLVKQIEEKDMNVKVEIRKGFLPKIIIYDLERWRTEEEIIEDIRIQNTDLEKAEFEKRFKVRFKLGNKNSPRVHFVCEVSPSIKAQFENIGRVYVGFTSCRVREYTNVTKCYKCQRFGHIAKYCREDKLVCGKCGDVGHLFKECKKEESRCVNCLRDKRKADHRTGSSACPAFQRALVIARQRQRYSDTE